MKKRLTRSQRKMLKYISLFFGILFVFIGSGEMITGSAIQGVVFVFLGVVLFLFGSLLRLQRY
ncbi:MAG: hypothetical protein H0Z30_09300 [Candidatus Marinimicrobia bacterium]|nr:hypothetical protein [Candidatus Neomarinimicrobiota bacterium]